jgi:simple sugar transport system permease protein
LGGAFAILAPSTIAGSSQTYEPINVIAANGFNGIAVALLGNSSPLGIIFSSVFISHIQRGGSQTSILGFKPEIIDVVISIIIYFSAFSLIMKAALGSLFRKRAKATMEVISEATVDIPDVTDSNQDVEDKSSGDMSREKQ